MHALSVQTLNLHRFGKVDLEELTAWVSLHWEFWLEDLGVTKEYIHLIWEWSVVLLDRRHLIQPRSCEDSVSAVAMQSPRRCPKLLPACRKVVIAFVS